MSIKGKLVAVIAAIVAVGCASTFKATHDHDGGHNFSNYQTFAWISTNPMKVGASAGVSNPLLEPRIMSSIENALVAKGYRFVPRPQSADFVLSFTIGSREEIRVDSYPSMSASYGRGWGWGGTYYGYGVGTQTTVRQYTEGMLAVDIFDVAEKRPVWHGVATKRISEKDREELQATIDAAVDAIMVGFPPE